MKGESKEEEEELRICVTAAVTVLL